MYAGAQLSVNLVRTWNSLLAFVMRYYLLLMVAIVSEGARIPRITESYVPGFQGIYHGHGAPAYQHGHANNYPAVPFSGDYRASYGNLDVGNDYYGGQHSIGGHGGDHFSGAPFNVAGNHGGFNSPGAVSRNYGRFNHAPDYDYHL